MNPNYVGPEITLEYLSQVLSSEDGLLGVSTLLLSIAALVGITKLFGRGSFSLLRLTLPSFVVVAYLLLMSTPSIIWFASSTDSVRLTYLLAVQFAPVLLLIGVLGANVWLRGASSRVCEFRQAVLAKTPQDRKLFPLFVSSLVVSVVVAATFVWTSDYVPLLDSLRSYGAAPGDEVRHSIYRLPDILIYTYALVVRFFLPFSVLYSYLMWSLYGKHWRIVFVLVLIWALFVALLPFERQSPLSIFVMLALGMYLRREGTLSLTQKWAGGGGAVLGGVLVGGILSQAQYQHELQPSEVLRYAKEFFVMRIWLDPSYMGYSAFELYNQTTSFLDGQSIRILAALGGMEFEHLSPVGYLADLWINFGWPGVIVGNLALGFVLQAIQAGLFIKKSIGTLLLYIVLLLNGAWLLYGSVLAPMVVSVYFLSAVVLLLMRGGVHRSVDDRSEDTRRSATRKQSASSWSA